MIYFIQSLLLPMSQTCYNSKVLKVIILNTWLFVFFHSLREMLNIHKLNITFDVSFANLMTILFSFLYLYTITFVNFKICYRNEDKLLPKKVTQTLEFFFTFLISAIIYTYVYFKIPGIIVNRIYHGLILVLASLSIYYFFLNFKFLNSETLLVKSYFITLSKFAILFSMASIIGMIVLKYRYPFIPTFLILISFFLFYNFRLYKRLHNNIILIPIFEKYNNASYRHHGL